MVKFADGYELRATGKGWATRNAMWRSKRGRPPKEDSPRSRGTEAQRHRGTEATRLPMHLSSDEAVRLFFFRYRKGFASRRGIWSTHLCLGASVAFSMIRAARWQSRRGASTLPADGASLLRIRAAAPIAPPAGVYAGGGHGVSIRRRAVVPGVHVRLLREQLSLEGRGRAEGLGGDRWGEWTDVASDPAHPVGRAAYPAEPGPRGLRGGRHVPGDRAAGLGLGLQAEHRAAPVASSR